MHQVQGDQTFNGILQKWKKPEVLLQSLRQCRSKKRPPGTASKEAAERKKAWIKRNKAKQRTERAAGINTEKYIYWDSRRDDRRRGFENDLTKKFIADELAKGCTYCGETKIRMTLDRIDNTRGHTKDNVNPACIRCNYVRGNMPYEAWVVLAKSMKKANDQGLFGEWTGRARTVQDQNKKTP